MSHEVDSGNSKRREHGGKALWGRMRLRGLVAWPPIGMALLGSLSASACTAQERPRSLSFLDACGGDDNSAAGNGPVRMARLADRKGQVTWRDSTATDWSPVSTNMPLRQGAEIYVPDNGKAEFQFDDGSRIRLRGNTLVTLQTLYSDDQGEFTEITLNAGTLYLHLKNKSLGLSGEYPFRLPQSGRSREPAYRRGHGREVRRTQRQRDR